MVSLMCNFSLTPLILPISGLNKFGNLSIMLDVNISEANTECMNLNCSAISLLGRFLDWNVVIVGNNIELGVIQIISLVNISLKMINNIQWDL